MDFEIIASLSSLRGFRTLLLLGFLELLDLQLEFLDLGQIGLDFSLQINDGLLRFTHLVSDFVPQRSQLGGHRLVGF